MKTAILLLFIIDCAINISAITLPFPYGPAAGDLEVPRQDDANVEVTVPTTAFYGSNFTKVYIDTNGAMFFDQYCHSCDIPSPFPARAGHMLIACYWADADPTLNNASHVYYRVSTDDQDWIRAQNYLKAYRDTIVLDMTPTNAARRLIIATWDQITYTGGSARTPTNTFQCAIVSDGKNSYVTFGFKELTWMTGQWDPDNYPVVGIDNGLPFGPRNNLTLPGSGTDNVTVLEAISNFNPTPKAGIVFGQKGMSKSQKAADPPSSPGGWSAFQAALLQPKPTPYIIPMGTPTVNCRVYSDPHYYSFDGAVIDSIAATFNQVSNEWWIMSATSDCPPGNKYPPFSVELLPMPANGGAVPPPGVLVPTGPGGLKFSLYLSALVLDNKDTNADLVIILGDNDYVVCFGPKPLPDCFKASDNSWSCCQGLPPDQCPCDKRIDAWSCPKSWCKDKNSNRAYDVSVTPNPTGFTVESLSLRLTATYHWGYGELDLPDVTDLQSNVFGYCGNMDKNPNNDGFCWNRTEETIEDYKYCWPETYLLTHESPTNPGYFTCPNYPKLVSRKDRKEKLKQKQSRSPAQLARAQRQITFGQAMCSIMTNSSGPFKDCLAWPGLTEQYNMCADDVGATNGDQAVLCAALNNLANSCMRQFPGKTFSWRTAHLCPPSCPANSQWSDTTTSCPDTCDLPFASQLCSTPPTSGCACNSGYVRRGAECVLPDQCGGCLSDDGSIKQLGKQWISSDCSQNCTCKANSTVQCSPIHCDSKATCQPSASGPTCVCSAGYHGNGYFCGADDHCVGNNCKNGAICISNQLSYQCQCTIGYTGQFCDQIINHCLNSPCVNGGTCSNSLTGFSCSCAFSYGGLTCEQRTDPCASFPCENLANCTSNFDAQSWSCTCPSGYTGLQCENAVVTSTVAPTSTIPAVTTQKITSKAPTTGQSSSTFPSSITTSASVAPFTGSDSLNCKNLPNGPYPIPGAVCTPWYDYCLQGIRYRFQCHDAYYYNNACRQKVPGCPTFAPGL